ncbi:MAG: replication initiator protein A [Rhodobacteraceae bacterium]|nr:replication initiator protein A [Paracoccaceae bacterium]
MGGGRSRVPLVSEITKERSPLLPLRHEQGDFFVCDFFDATPKGDMGSMEHPVFSLSTKPDHRPRSYQRGDIFVKVKPGSDGLATVHDRDVLIYCISQVIAGIEHGSRLERVLHLSAVDLLIATNRPTAGTGYAGLKAALQRLQSTQIETNITTGGQEQIDMFSLIDRVRIVREHRDGRMLELEVTLSDWVFNAINSREVLTLNKRYFQLRKPLERRLYELARKHCGRQSEWRIGLEALREKTGSNSTAKEFKRLVGNIVKDDAIHDHMPDYTIRMMARIVVFQPRREFLESWNAKDDNTRPPLGTILHVSDRARENAKAIAVRYGWDLRAIEDDWRGWMGGKPTPENVDGAFVGFVKKWCEKRGNARY